VVSGAFVGYFAIEPMRRSSPGCWAEPAGPCPSGPLPEG
jgi:hypothetical protein